MEIDTEWLVDFFRRQLRLGFEEGDYTRTRNCCNGLLQHQPADSEALSMLGEAALASRDSATAKRAFEKLLELNPTQVDYAMQLAKAYLQLQDWAAARAALQQVLELEPGHAQARDTLELIAQLHQRLELISQFAEVEPGRNDPCPCGSGLKYKKCCLAKSSQQVLKQRLLEAFAAADWNNVLSLGGDIETLDPTVLRAESLARYYLGQRKSAYPLLKQACQAFADDMDLLAARADLELDNDIALAQRLAQQVLAQDASQWRAALVLAACHARRQEGTEVESTLRQLTQSHPECDMAWQRLWSYYSGARRAEDSVAVARTWTQLCPRNAEAWVQLGMAILLIELATDEALQALEHALSLSGNHHEALCWLGLWYQKQQDPQRALGFLLRGLQIKPDYQLGWNMLGGVYHSVGRQHEAEGCFMRALAIAPEQAKAWNNLANTYLDAGLLDEAEKVRQVGLALDPNEPNLWNNLGNILSADRRLKEAKVAYLKAREVDPEYRPVLINLAGVESEFGNLDGAIDLLRGELDANQARTNILFFANYHPDWSGEQVFAVYQEVVKRYFPPRHYFAYPNERITNRRLRIGYVTPDFRHHVGVHFTEPLLSQHDHSQVEVFVYSLVRREDLVTERFINYADHWRHCVGLSDLAVAEQVRTDQIDILIDLAAHTAGNGLNVFALKPAPVQVCWWVGFAFGTGLPQMDYFLADQQMLPAGCESSFAETLWRMPGPSIAYQANSSMPEASALPAAKSGYITFGSLTRPVRINYKVIRVWAELLKRVANSRLILDSGAFKDQGLCEHYRQQFAAYGIAPERLSIGYTSPVWDVLAAMDIALDCFPHNSGTTLFESLWMGLPFISLADRPSMGRVGATILHGAGHDEWIAYNEAEYLDKLVALAADVPALAATRAGLREQMKRSPLCDGADFARRMEHTYRQMWQRYCEQGEQ
jgi:protein O-GlcNAc transferase